MHSKKLRSRRSRKYRSNFRKQTKKNKSAKSHNDSDIGNLNGGNGCGGNGCVGNGGGDIGGGIMDMIIYERKDKSTLPFGLSRYDPSLLFKQTGTNPNKFRIIYNRGSPYEIDLTARQNQELPSSQAISKPHIVLPDMNHYLVALVESPAMQQPRLRWLSSYKIRNWEKDIISYSMPVLKPRKKRAYELRIYKYPMDMTEMYKPVESTTTLLKDEYRNFQIYLATHKMIQLLPKLTIRFHVKYDDGNILSLLSGVGTRSQSGSMTQSKMALRQEYRAQEMAPPKM
jgi:hypothetical protein